MQPTFLLRSPPTSAAVVDSGGQYHERMARSEAFTTWLKEVLFTGGEEDAKSLLVQSVSTKLLYIDRHVYTHVRMRLLQKAIAQS